MDRSRRDRRSETKAQEGAGFPQRESHGGEMEQRDTAIRRTYWAPHGPGGTLIGQRSGRVRSRCSQLELFSVSSR
jgi:hypothetical protein